MGPYKFREARGKRVWIDVSAERPRNVVCGTVHRKAGKGTYQSDLQPSLLASPLIWLAGS